MRVAHRSTHSTLGPLVGRAFFFDSDAMTLHALEGADAEQAESVLEDSLSDGAEPQA
jgi:hypothetical protein